MNKSQRKCKTCGQEKFIKDGRDTCYDCGQRSKGGGGERAHGGGDKGGGLPKENIFSTFYLPSGYLKPEVLLDKAEKLAERFEKEKMSQSSFRSLFNLLKATERRIKTEGDDLKLDAVRETYAKFIRLCEYQNRRKVIPDIFLTFAREHTEVAMKSKKEFQGFVEYLASIYARMKTKN